MLDRIIRGGEVIDGTGAPAKTADVGIRDGQIVAVGQVDESAREVISADGLWVTPGWVDVFTPITMARSHGTGNSRLLRFRA